MLFRSEKFQRADDFVHKENVKVYRNVQAVVTEELKKHAQTGKSADEELKNAVESLEREFGRRIGKKLNAVMIISILSLILSASGVALYVLRLLMMWGIIK